VRIEMQIVSEIPGKIIIGTGGGLLAIFTHQIVVKHPTFLLSLAFQINNNRQNGQHIHLTLISPPQGRFSLIVQIVDLLR
jgi:hypothetical protein